MGGADFKVVIVGLQQSVKATIAPFCRAVGNFHVFAGIVGNMIFDEGMPLSNACHASIVVKEVVGGVAKLVKVSGVKQLELGNFKQSDNQRVTGIAPVQQVASAGIVHYQ